jgi:hypothetical protein
MFNLRIKEEALYLYLDNHLRILVLPRKAKSIKSKLSNAGHQ